MTIRLRPLDLPLIALASFCLGLCGDLAPRLPSHFVSKGPAAEALAPSDPRPSPSEIELLLDAAYRRRIASFEVGGESLELGLPFGQNDERGKGEYEQEFFAGGRAEPEAAWARVGEILASEDFLAYAWALLEPGALVVGFDLAAASWSALSPESASAFQGSGDDFVLVPHRGAGLSAAEVYDYLYCVGRVGLDCAGFVYGIQRDLARELGADLDALLSPALNIEKDKLNLMIGLWLFEPARGRTHEVGERLADIRPGDIFLFRGKGGRFGHCAVVLSIDRAAGVLRYAQDTDWAPRPLRGVHESFIIWEGGKGNIGLGGPEVKWLQSLAPAFPGEEAPMWGTDGDRFRTQWPQGGSLVVRLDALRAIIESSLPGFYAGE